MDITINSRKSGTWHFRCGDSHSESSYVWCRTNFHSEWKQPCYGGSFIGSTISTTPLKLRRVALRWLKDRTRALVVTVDRPTDPATPRNYARAKAERDYLLSTLSEVWKIAQGWSQDMPGARKELLERIARISDNALTKCDGVEHKR